MKVEKSIMYFVTGNENKFSEISHMFGIHEIPFKLHQLDLDPVEIQADSLREVALFKLNYVKEKINDSFFVEDAGFFVEKPLKGFPGIYSSYVFKTLGNEGILSLIDNFQKTEAYFRAVIALYYKPLDEIYTFEGAIKGKISDKIRGTHGFGFDPIFVPDIIPDKTFSELTTEEKNKISHRGNAIISLIKFLKEI